MNHVHTLEIFSYDILQAVQLAVNLHNIISIKVHITKYWSIDRKNPSYVQAKYLNLLIIVTIKVVTILCNEREHLSIKMKKNTAFQKAEEADEA